MSQTKQERNKALVLEAFHTLFNKRNYIAAERYWSPTYTQHSAHIAPGREGLFNLIKSLPPTLKYEPGVIVADGDLVIVHGRFSGFGAPVNWIAADILRIEDGVLVDPGRPDRGGFERREELDVEKAGGIGAVIGPALLRDDGRDFGETADQPAHLVDVDIALLQ